MMEFYNYDSLMDMHENIKSSDDYDVLFCA